MLFKVDLTFKSEDEDSRSDPSVLQLSVLSNGAVRAVFRLFSDFFLQNRLCGWPNTDEFRLITFVHHRSWLVQVCCYFPVYLSYSYQVKFPTFSLHAY